MGLDRPKQFLELSGKPLLVHTLEALAQADFLAAIFLIVPEGFLEQARKLCSDFLMTDGYVGPSLRVVVGGAERQDSVYNGLRHLPDDCEWVLVHDGVRPFVSLRLIRDTMNAALETGASIAAVPSTDTVKRVDGGVVVETLARESIWLVQTPQVFRKDILIRAYDTARKQNWSATDDAAFVERSGHSIKIVNGDRSNIKITTPEDLAWASFLFGRNRAGQAPLKG
jgi:2-C-methyl-D-erythritol 4-phosphate cytidylyltransferase